MASLPQLTLKRVTKNRADGTFGVLLLEGMPICATMERPWKNNLRGESCIPAGRYKCRRVLSPKFGDTFEVTAVPNRSAILFHGGNIMEDSHGCIILGESFNLLPNGRCSLSSSRIAVAEFKQLLLGKQEFDLEILEV